MRTELGQSDGNTFRSSLSPSMRGAAVGGEPSCRPYGRQAELPIAARSAAKEALTNRAAAEQQPQTYLSGWEEGRTDGSQRAERTSSSTVSCTHIM